MAVQSFSPLLLVPPWTLEVAVRAWRVFTPAAIVSRSTVNSDVVLCFLYVCSDELTRPCSRLRNHILISVRLASLRTPDDKNDSGDMASHVKH